MRPVPRALLALTLGGSAALWPAVALAAGSGSITTGPTAEAWYRAAQSCVLPVGCAPTLPSQYAPDTLHVGVLAGQEEARTFLQLDLSALPAGTKPVGGQLRLPLATGPRDGTRAANTTALRACLATEVVEDAAGETGTGPKVDCAAVSTDAVFVAASAEAPAAFTVDLTALADAWTTAAAPGALALLPAEGVAPTAGWHVAFSDRTREGGGVAKITAALSFVSAAVDVQQQPAPAVPAPVDTGSLPPPDFSPSDSFGAPPVSSFEAPSGELPSGVAPEAPAPAPQAAPQQQVVPVATFLDDRFRYPAVFLLPLAFAAAVAWLGRALTRDLAADAVS